MRKWKKVIEQLETEIALLFPPDQLPDVRFPKTPRSRSPAGVCFVVFVFKPELILTLALHHHPDLEPLRVLWQQILWPINPFRG